MKQILKSFCCFLILALLFTGCATTKKECSHSDERLINSIISNENLVIINTEVENNGLTVNLEWAFSDGINLYLLVSSYNKEYTLDNFNITSAYIMIGSQKIGINYKKSVLIHGNPSCLLKFNLNITEAQNGTLIIEGIDKIDGSWQIPFKTNPANITKYSINKNYESQKMNVYIDYIEITDLNTIIKCTINTLTKDIPLVHLTSYIKGNKDTYNYIEGTGEGKKSQSNYYLTFDGISDEKNIYIYLELKNGEKINIQLDLS